VQIANLHQPLQAFAYPEEQTKLAKSLKKPLLQAASFCYVDNAKPKVIESPQLNGENCRY
jgi:hypothetical protein